MRTPLEQGAPVPLRGYLSENGMETAFEQVLSKLRGGTLPDLVEAKFGVKQTGETRFWLDGFSGNWDWVSGSYRLKIKHGGAGFYHEFYDGKLARPRHGHLYRKQGN